MFAEVLARVGTALLDGTAPDGKAYWSKRYWDRAQAEDSFLGPHFLIQKSSVAEMIAAHAPDVETVIEFCCGTGEFSMIAAERTAARQITALDISAHALEQARRRVKHDGLRLVQGDFWTDHGLAPAQLVMCLDAIHHLGTMEDVLRRLMTFVEPGGLLIGNVWTGDRFHEFERIRYGRAKHLVRTLGFFWTALLIKFSGARLKTGSYRTQLRTNDAVASALRQVSDEVVALDRQPYFTSFVCRRAR
jgi:SAM-dependent methyltransferase